jgi:Mg2+ and Co2+ transporter CorA
MKFAGTVKGNFKLIEDLTPDQLKELEPDFMWLDVDRVDPPTETTLKEIYGIESISSFGFPSIISYGNYDLIRINYFEELSNNELLVIVSEKYVITVHQGTDSVSDEAMASVNEMMVSGGLNTGTILRNIFSTVLERHAVHLQKVQNVLHGMDQKLRAGVSDVSRLTQLNANVQETKKVFYATRDQLADLIIQNISVKGIDDPQEFSDLYIKMNEMSRAADYFTTVIDKYMNALIASTWDHMNSTKKMSTGLALMSIFFGAAAIFRIFFPLNVPIIGMDSIYFVIAIMIAGVIAFIVAQRTSKFTLT